MIIIGIIVGTLLSFVFAAHIEDSNLVAPAMMFTSLGINISTLFIGLLVGFAITSTIRKQARIDKLLSQIKNKQSNIATDRNVLFLFSFIMSFVLISVVGNIPTFMMFAITAHMFYRIVISYLNNNDLPDRTAISVICFVIGVAFICALITVLRINNLNIFVLFYGFITIPAYIFPYKTVSNNLSGKGGSVRGLTFSLDASCVIAQGFILGQAIATNSQRDSIGTLINSFMPNEMRLIVAFIFIVCFVIYYCSKKLDLYIKDAPLVVSDNTKLNNKFAFVNIIIGAFVGLTQTNPFIFVFITLCGIACAIIIRNNDALRSMIVPNLLVAGLATGY